MKNIDYEKYALEAVASHRINYPDASKDWPSDIEENISDAFTFQRMHGFLEVQNKNLERCLQDKDKEIWQHKKAIENLRGYMGFLESQIEQLKSRLDEHEDSY